MAHLGWTFTCESPCPDNILHPDWPVWLMVGFVIWHRERVGDSGAFRLRGYLEFHSKQKVTVCRKLISIARWEPRNGHQDRAIASIIDQTEMRAKGPWQYGKKTAWAGRKVPAG